MVRKKVWKMNLPITPPHHQNVKLITKKMNTLTLTIKRKNLPTKILDPECIPLILKSDCPTRWNNKYLVWERLLKLRKPLINTLMEAQSWPGAKNTSIYDIEITHREWNFIQQFVNALECFEEATKMLSSSHAFHQ